MKTLEDSIKDIEVSVIPQPIPKLSKENARSFDWRYMLSILVPWKSNLKNNAFIWN